MRKVPIVLIVVLCFSSSVSFIHTDASRLSTYWLYVGGTGPGNYTTIQDAINASDTGDTIFVYNGVYMEHVSVGAKDSLTLTGEDRASTIIDANWWYTAFSIGVCDGCHISGFTFRNATYDCCVLGDSEATHATNNTITGCIARNSLGAGVKLDSEGNLHNNTISNLEIFDCQTGFYLAEYASLVHDNRITGNIIHDNEIGMSCQESGDDRDGFTHNVFSDNTIYNNSYGCKFYHMFNDNILFHNSFVNNSINAFDEGVNTWYNTTLHEGNYYDDYTGEDLNGDGIGDTPYNVSGGNNQDLYPLMDPLYNDSMLIQPSNMTVPENTEFTVTVTTVMHQPLPAAHVSFNNLTKNTNATGAVTFIAPTIDNNTCYLITASKEGYLNASCTITVTDTPKTSPALVFGRITNLSTSDDSITFQAINTRIITLHPLTTSFYTSHETIIMSTTYKGLISQKIIFVITDYTYTKN